MLLFTCIALYLSLIQRGKEFYTKALRRLLTRYSQRHALAAASTVACFILIVMVHTHVIYKLKINHIRAAIL